MSGVGPACRKTGIPFPTLLAGRSSTVNGNGRLPARLWPILKNYAALSILMQNPAVRLIAVGGTMDPLERSTFGTVCEGEFAAYRPDLAFLTINAVNYQDGYTDFRLDEIGVIQTLAQTARRVIAVMDSSKLGQCSKRQVFSPEQVDLLLMDDHIPSEVKEKYRSKGIEIQ